MTADKEAATMPPSKLSPEFLERLAAVDAKAAAERHGRAIGANAAALREAFDRAAAHHAASRRNAGDVQEAIAAADELYIERVAELETITREEVANARLRVQCAGAGQPVSEDTTQNAAPGRPACPMGCGARFARWADTTPPHSPGAPHTGPELPDGAVGTPSQMSEALERAPDLPAWLVRAAITWSPGDPPTLAPLRLAQAIRNREPAGDADAEQHLAEAATVLERRAGRDRPAT